MNIIKQVKIGRLEYLLGKDEVIQLYYTVAKVGKYEKVLHETEMFKDALVSFKQEVIGAL